MYRGLNRRGSSAAFECTCGDSALENAYLKVYGVEPWRLLAGVGEDIPLRFRELRRGVFVQRAGARPEP